MKHHVLLMMSTIIQQYRQYAVPYDMFSSRVRAMYMEYYYSTINLIFIFL